MRENKRVGSVTELKVKLSFIELGYNVSTPYGDCESYDLIADVDGQLIRVQCKTAETIDDGETFDVDFRRNRCAERYEKTNRFYENDEIDFFATHFNGKSYLIPAGIGGVKKRFRIKPMRRENYKKINWARDYEIKTIIDKLKNNGGGFNGKDNKRKD